MLVPFIAVAGYLLISSASRINTHPDLENDMQLANRTPAPGTSPLPSRAATPDPMVEARRVARQDLAIKELLVDRAASQYQERAKTQVKAHETYVQEVFECSPVRRALHTGRGLDAHDPESVFIWHDPRRPGPEPTFDPESLKKEPWIVSFRCVVQMRNGADRSAYMLNAMVHLAFRDGRWEIAPETQQTLSSEGFLSEQIASLNETQDAYVLKPTPTIAVPSFR